MGRVSLIDILCLLQLVILCLLSHRNSRYLFKVDDLIKKLTSSKAFRWTIRAQAPCVYLSMDVVDLTSNQDFKCVAIAGRSQGPNASSNHLASEPLREMAMVLRIQENQPNFKR